jgi:hypothetical protein
MTKLEVLYDSLGQYSQVASMLIQRLMGGARDPSSPAVALGHDQASGAPNHRMGISVVRGACGLSGLGCTVPSGACGIICS